MDLYEIRQGLLKPGKSRAGLAERLGVDVSQISRLLNGKRHLKVHELPIIEDYLYGDEGLPAGINGAHRDPTHDNGSAGFGTSPQHAEALSVISQLIDEADRHQVDVAAIIVKALRQAIEDSQHHQRRPNRDWL